MKWIKKIYAKYLFPTDYFMSRHYEKAHEKYNLHIMNSVETLDYIERKNCSVARFGEGEFELIMWPERSIGFQEHDEALSEELKKVLCSSKKDLLICIPYALNCIRGRTRESREFWYYWWERNNQGRTIVEFIQKQHDSSDFFGDTQISRPYIAWPTERNAEAVFLKLKRLWDKKDIIIVEGTKTRLGVGNDLFIGARTIKRVLGPATNAFSKRERILEAVKNIYENELVLLALGPTATVLAYQLSEIGIRAIDIGHIDIEYEWYLRKSKAHERIPGKYTNEAMEGSQVVDCKDKMYLQQIVAIID